MAACHAVFGTYELLEKILLSVPPFELVTATKVCAAWRTLIHGWSRLPNISPISPMPRSDILPSTRIETIYSRGTRLRLNPLLPREGEGERIGRTSRHLRGPRPSLIASTDSASVAPTNVGGGCKGKSGGSS